MISYFLSILLIIHSFKHKKHKFFLVGLCALLYVFVCTLCLIMFDVAEYGKIFMYIKVMLLTAFIGVTIKSFIKER